jgi:two-component system, chemotaxis family, protein-glutamate methylesterase/glutaminase
MAKTVMIIDDAAMMRTVIRNLVQSDKSYNVIASCENGQVALDTLKTHQPDIILVDIEMPVMDGLTFLRHARLRTRAKIVVLSSIAASGSPKALEARKLGADAVIQKPSGSVSLDLAAKSGDTILQTLKRLAA